MRFKSFRSFEKTCLNLENIKKTLRYNYDRMQPIIQKNLKKAEYLVLEPQQREETQQFEDYRNLKHYIHAKRKQD